jgi:hypothetical protein
VQLFAMFLGATWLAGHHEIPIYLTIAVAAIWFFDVARARADRRRALALGAITLVFTALTSGFQTAPGYEYAREAVRWVGIEHPVAWNEPVPPRIRPGSASASQTRHSTSRPRRS